MVDLVGAIDIVCGCGEEFVDGLKHADSKETWGLDGNILRTMSEFQMGMIGDREPLKSNWLAIHVIRRLTCILWEKGWFGKGFD